VALLQKGLLYVKKTSSTVVFVSTVDRGLTFQTGRYWISRDLTTTATKISTVKKSISVRVFRNFFLISPLCDVAASVSYWTLKPLDDDDDDGLEEIRPSCFALADFGTILETVLYKNFLGMFTMWPMFVATGSNRASKFGSSNSLVKLSNNVFTVVLARSARSNTLFTPFMVSFHTFRNPGSLIARLAQ